MLYKNNYLINSFAHWTRQRLCSKSILHSHIEYCDKHKIKISLKNYFGDNGAHIQKKVRNVITQW